MGVTWCTGAGSLQESSHSTTHFWEQAGTLCFKPSPGDLDHVPKISNFLTQHDFGLTVLLTALSTCHMTQTWDFPHKKKKKTEPKQTLDPNKNRLP